MKNLLLILLVVPFLANGQEATIHFDIKNAADSRITIFRGDNASAEVVFGDGSIGVPLTSAKATHTFKLSKPVFARVLYRSATTKAPSIVAFYLSPGDDLYFSVDANNLKTSVVTGRGSNNNQPLIQQLIGQSFDLEVYKKDSLPNNVFKAIKEKAELNRDVLKKYVATYHPTKDFIQMHSLFAEYFTLWEFIDFKGSQGFSAREPFFRNETRWQALADSLVQANPVNNDELLSIPNQTDFLFLYLIRLKERVWRHPELGKEYYTEDEASAIKDDPENLLQEKIINKHFSGKTAEFLYASLFDRSLNEKEDNLPEIFARFKQKYPQSQYTSYIEPGIVKIEARRKRTLSSDMTLIENSKSLQTFDDVLKLVKGKTVFLDMWGTWCGPCRSELVQNSDSIKNHFKNSGLNYLYIANFDEGKEVKWKELISYYGLTGTHILANQNLTKDIMANVKGQGYPTYVIIKKDGTFELSKAGYPMDRKILYKQLEKVLSN